VELLSSEARESGRSLRYRFRHANENLLVATSVGKDGLLRDLRFGPE
jgi:hypothetical protein